MASKGGEGKPECTCYALHGLSVLLLWELPDFLSTKISPAWKVRGLRELEALVGRAKLSSCMR